MKETLTLLERCQREAMEKLHGWTVNVLEHQVERDYIASFMDTLIANTLKQAAEALEELSEKQFYDSREEALAGKSAFLQAQRLLVGEDNG
jgi:hypothetical protein